MKRIPQLLVLWFIVSALNAAETTKRPIFEIRLVLDKPSADSEQMKMMRPDREGQAVPVVINVAKGALLDDSDVKSANVQSDPISGKPQVGITFTEQGRKAFAEVTRTNINKQIAILIDGQVVSAPIIRAEIRKGPIPIEGFTKKEAEELAKRINAVAHENQPGKMKPWPHGLYDQLKMVR